jgi:tetratricopeptide (TPR) repeat protein
MRRTLPFPILQWLIIAGLSFSMIGCVSGKHGIPGATTILNSNRFDLGRHTFPIATNVSEAQKAFDRGLTLAYAFSHGAAEKEFRRAAELDPLSPMPWWGVALVNGPHINNPQVPPDKAMVAWEALSTARRLRANGNELENSLIDALSVRYDRKQPKDRSRLDRAYAAAMKKVWSRYSHDADIATLYAEALMDLHPWDLWTHSGEPKAWTPEIVRTLEQAMTLNPAHPGALHLYIHVVEASDNPERGLAAADQLGDLVPGAGHLVHMPAHIYLRVGRWDSAAMANERAILADAEFRKTNPQPGFYAVYMLHNRHFLAFVRMMQGQKAAALKAAREMIDSIPAGFLEEYGPVADGFLALPYEVLMRFGDWNQILLEPEPSTQFPLSYALWRFARASALMALDRTGEAKAERMLFDAAARRVPEEATFGNNRAKDILKIAEYVLNGESAAREKHFDAALTSLRDAVRLEDTLMYDEPPDWILPARHALGITLLRVGRADEAEKIYREDLKRFPANGWSLFGLGRALLWQSKAAEAEAVMEQFSKEWKGADIKIQSSCLCQPGV